MEQPDKDEYYDIVTELEDWAYIVDKSQGEAYVVMLNGSVFQKAATEISRLRDVVDAYRRRLSRGGKESVDL